MKKIENKILVFVVYLCIVMHSIIRFCMGGKDTFYSKPFSRMEYNFGKEIMV